MTAGDVPVAGCHDRETELGKRGPCGCENRHSDGYYQCRHDERAHGGEQLIDPIPDRRLPDPEPAAILVEPVRGKRGHFATARSMVASFAFTAPAISAGSGA